MSSDSDRLNTDSAIWLARLERGLQGQEGVQLRQWLQVPAQRDTIVEDAKLYHGPDIVAVLAEMVPVGFGTPAPKIPKRIFSPFNVAVAVGMLALMVVPPMLAHLNGARSPPARPQDPPLPWGEHAYSTKDGQTRTFKLEDGSTLTLNSHTRVGVQFGVGSRVATVQYGEALFDIDRRRERPFQIDAAGRHFYAPQSRFDVRVIDPETVELTVLDGNVTILALPWHWPDTPAEARLFDPQVFADTKVGPMQSAFLQDRTMTRLAITADNARTRLSWEPERVFYITQ
ncbi:MAG TPA: FecR domain-containing protein [Steroidobacteraceae bacterium]|nr:FecR domain-containing protein [Steroidobacteraceae bacterium]